MSTLHLQQTVRGWAAKPGYNSQNIYLSIYLKLPVKSIAEFQITGQVPAPPLSGNHVLEAVSRLVEKKPLRIITSSALLLQDKNPQAKTEQHSQLLFSILQPVHLYSYKLINNVSLSHKQHKESFMSSERYSSILFQSYVVCTTFASPLGANIEELNVNTFIFSNE